MQIVYQKPLLDEVDLMQNILEFEVQKGYVLPRNKESFAKEIRSFWAAFGINQDKREMLGFCALQIYSQSLGEIRSLVVAEPYRNQGIASNLVQKVIKEGRELGISEFLVLTYHPRLFEFLGFHQIEKTCVPNQKIWADCVSCKHFPNCNEIALLKKY